MNFYPKILKIHKVSVFIICLIIFLFTSKSAISQENTEFTKSQRKNIISGGLFGDGSFVSIAYQRILPVSEMINFYAKLGAGFTFFSTGWLSPSNNLEFTPVFVFPHQITISIGKKNNFEVGVNGSYFSDGISVRRNYGWETTSTYKLFPLIGYRFNFENKGRHQEYFGIYLLLSKNFEKYYFLFVPVGIHGGIRF